MAKRWLEYLLLLAGCGAFYIFWQDYLSAFVLALFLCLPLLSLLLLAPAALFVRAELEQGAGRCPMDAPIPLHIRVRASPLTARVRLRLVLRNETFGLERRETVYLSAAGKALTLQHRIVSDYCGQLTCRLAEVRVYDPLGLFFLRRRPRDASAALFILPRVYSPQLRAGGADTPDAEGERFSPTTAGNDPTEFFGIRAFREGDRLSRVHWKLSARLGRDMVVEGGLPVSESAFLLVETGGEPAVLQALLDVFCTLAAALLERRQPIRAGWYDSAGQPASRVIAGEEDLYGAVEAILATARPCREPLALEACRNPGGCSHAVYLTFAFPDGAAALMHERFPTGKRTVLLVGDAPAENASIDPEVIRVHPARVEKSLKGFAI